MERYIIARGTGYLELRPYDAAIVQTGLFCHATRFDEQTARQLLAAGAGDRAIEIDRFGAVVATNALQRTAVA
jgi:hypothetical protein